MLTPTPFPVLQLEELRGLNGKARWLLETRFYDRRLLQVRGRA
jgi:hypothetical protein